MRILLLVTGVLGIGLLLSRAAGGGQRDVSPPGTGPIPDGLGTNIHFTDPRPGEMKMLAEGGFHWIRMDFSWGGTERKKGQYDFSAYDRLLTAMEPYGLRALFILDYSNRLYETDRSVRTPEGRAAMASWAAAAVTRFKGRGILWEMWNEPNISFWQPAPNVQDYVALAKAVGAAIRKAAPAEMYIGPATSGIDMKFLEGCFRGGLLEDWCAVSVHPYRQQPPETAAGDYARLRLLIDKYAPKGKAIPILSGEWGYSSAWGGMDEARQGRLLPRQWLTNLASGIPLSIWYDWHDDGTNPKEPEHHFGTVAHAYHEGKSPVYDPKPAYLAARTLTTVLKGLRFNKRLACGPGDNYVLLLTGEKRQCLAAWTTGRKPRDVSLPAAAGNTFHVIGHTGEKAPDVRAGADGLAVTLSDAPQYFVPAKASDDVLSLAAAWEAAPPAMIMPGGERNTLSLKLTNPLAEPIRLSVGPGPTQTLAPGAQTTLTRAFRLPRSDEPVEVLFAITAEGLGSVAQRTEVHADNPLKLTVLPPAGGELGVRVENPAGAAFDGRLTLTGVAGLEPKTDEAPLVLAAGQKEKVVGFLLKALPAGEYSVGLVVTDAGGGEQLRVGPLKFAAVDDFARCNAKTLPAAYAAVGDGDAKVGSKQSVALAAPPAGPPPGKAACLRIRYEMNAGWKFVRLAVLGQERRRIAGRPAAMGLWLWSDGTGNSPRLRFTDAAGQTFQPVSEPLTWTGWRYVTFDMTGRAAGHWGGPDDGAVRYPIHWDTLILIDKPRDQASRGEVYVASPTLIYGVDVSTSSLASRGIG